MFKEVTKEKAVEAAMNGQDAYMIYGTEYSYTTNIKDRLNNIFNEADARFLVDVPDPMENLENVKYFNDRFKIILDAWINDTAEDLNMEPNIIRGQIEHCLYPEEGEEE